MLTKENEGEVQVFLFLTSFPAAATPAAGDLVTLLWEPLLYKT